MYPTRDQIASARKTMKEAFEKLSREGTGIFQPTITPINASPNKPNSETPTAIEAQTSNSQPR